MTSFGDFCSEFVIHAALRLVKRVSGSNVRHRMSPTLVCIAAVTALIAIVWRRKLRRNYSANQKRPPAVPGALPWVGNALQVDRLRPHITLSKWFVNFGHVYRYERKRSPASFIFPIFLFFVIAVSTAEKTRDMRPPANCSVGGIVT